MKKIVATVLPFCITTPSNLRSLRRFLGGTGGFACHPLGCSSCCSVGQAILPAAAFQAAPCGQVANLPHTQKVTFRTPTITRVSLPIFAFKYPKSGLVTLFPVLSKAPNQGKFPAL
jgi:hypothetical protein